MPRMHTIKSSNGNHRILKWRQGIDVVMNLHKVRKANILVYSFMVCSFQLMDCTFARLTISPFLKRRNLMSLYTKRGVSAQKEEVHAAIEKLDKGLYPNAFCKIFPDIIGNDDNFVNIMHADGAGTKSILAYLYWKETGDLSVWKGIAQDAIVMNLDDMICAGIYTDLLFSSSIDRNKSRIPGEVLQALIEGRSEEHTS